MATDFEDWTRGVTVITGATPVGADFPDWTVAVAVEGGGGGGAYASLTGPGETTTPGDLTQAGGFVVADPGSTGVLLGTTGGNVEATGVSFITNTQGLLLEVSDSTPAVVGTISMTNTTPGCEIDTQDLILIKSEQSNVEIRADNASVSITGDTTGFGGITLDASSINIGVTSGDKIGFFNPAGGPVVRPTVTGSRGGNAALASLLTGLANLGLITNSTTP